MGELSEVVILKPDIAKEPTRFARLFQKIFLHKEIGPPSPNIVKPGQEFILAQSVPNTPAEFRLVGSMNFMRSDKNEMMILVEDLPDELKAMDLSVRVSDGKGHARVYDGSENDDRPIIIKNNTKVHHATEEVRFVHTWMLDEQNPCPDIQDLPREEMGDSLTTGRVQLPEGRTAGDPSYHHLWLEVKGVEKSLIIDIQQNPNPGKITGPNGWEKVASRLVTTKLIPNSELKKGTPTTYGYRSR